MKHHTIQRTTWAAMLAVASLSLFAANSASAASNRFRTHVDPSIDTPSVVPAKATVDDNNSGAVAPNSTKTGQSDERDSESESASASVGNAKVQQRTVSKQDLTRGAPGTPEAFGRTSHIIESESASTPVGNAKVQENTVSKQNLTRGAPGTPQAFGRTSDIESESASTSVGNTNAQTSMSDQTQTGGGDLSMKDKEDVSVSDSRPNAAAAKGGLSPQAIFPPGGPAFDLTDHVDENFGGSHGNAVRGQQAAVPAGTLSAGASANGRVDLNSITPLPTSVPVPVVDVTAAADTNTGVQLGSTVGGQQVLPPISLPGLPNAGNPLAPVTGVLASLPIPVDPGSVNPLAPVTGVLASLLIPVDPGSVNPLAPVTGVISTATGALGSTPLAPVSGLLGSVTGALPH